MPYSTQELIDAREAAQSLLDRLGLEAYLFEVEPRDDAFGLHVECAAEGDTWERVQFPVEVDRLRATRYDDIAAAQLLADWQQALASCKSSETRPGE